MTSDPHDLVSSSMSSISPVFRVTEQESVPVPNDSNEHSRSLAIVPGMNKPLMLLDTACGAASSLVADITDLRVLPSFTIIEKSSPS